jgi:DNA-binding response OmpR family regulator
VRRVFYRLLFFPEGLQDLPGPVRIQYEEIRMGRAMNTTKERTVLVAEDEDPIRSLMETVLRRSGYRVLASACGARALELFFENAAVIDFLVLEVSLPKLRGPEIARRAREIRPDIPVLFASGSFRLEPFVCDDFVAGAAFLEKPYTMGQLLAAVEGLEYGVGAEAAVVSK